MKKKCDWLFLKFDVIPNVLLCTRCKETFEVPSRMSFNLMNALFKGFEKDHKNCKEVSP
jgi:hypothetical protein